MRGWWASDLASLRATSCPRSACSSARIRWTINQHAAALYTRRGAPQVEIALSGTYSPDGPAALQAMGRDARESWSTPPCGASEPPKPRPNGCEAQGRRVARHEGAQLPTMRDDIRIIEVRKATDNQFHILTDGNMALGNGDAGGDNPTLWNFRRAVPGSSQLGAYWLEEPLLRARPTGRTRSARRASHGRRRGELGHP